MKAFHGVNDLKLEDLRQINILTGRNNSGKTTILEVIQNLKIFTKQDSMDEEICHIETGDLFNTKIPIISNTTVEFDRNLKKIFEFPDLYKEAMDVLKEYDDGIIEIQYNSKKEIGMHHDVYKIISKSSKSPIPLNICGDGMKKTLFFMAAVMQAQNGILLIDNFEISIHPSVMNRTFRWLLRACKKLNIQVFLTSHNKEAINKMLKCDSEIVSDIAVYTLSKIDEKTVARRVSGEKAIEMQDHMGLEIR